MTTTDEEAKSKRLPGPKISKDEPIRAIQTKNGYSPKKSMAESTNNDSTTEGAKSSKNHKKVTNSLNPEKLKQYLIKSQNEDVEVQPLNQKASSRN